MPSNLGPYPLTDPIVDPSTGKMTDNFEKVFRGIYTSTQGSVKTVGIFNASAHSVDIPATTLRAGSSIDIIALYNNTALVGEPSVAVNILIGTTVIATATLSDETQATGVFRITAQVISKTQVGSVYSWTDRNGLCGMQLSALLAMPDMTQPITISISRVDGLNSHFAGFLAVKTYT